MNEDKNILNKMYSVNSYPQVIDFSDIKKFFRFETEKKSFKEMSEQSFINPNINCIVIDATIVNTSKKK